MENTKNNDRDQTGFGGFVSASQMLLGQKKIECEGKDKKEGEDDTVEIVEVVPGNLSADKGQPTKKRRIQMGLEKCYSLSQTTEGALPLTNPAMVKTSSKDPNRGLYPRRPALPIDPANKGGFVSAKEVMDGPSLSQFMPSSQVHNNSRRVKSKIRVSQTNKLGNYFTSIKTNTSTLPQASGSGLSSSQPVMPNYPLRDDSNKHFSMSQGAITPPKDTKPVARKSSPMYSPIKKVEGTSGTYTMDTSCASSSQSDFARVWPQLPTPFTQTITKVSKNLFDVQKTGKSNTKSTAKKSSKKPAPKFNRDNAFLYSTEKPVPMKCKSVVGDRYGLLGHGGQGDPEHLVNYFETLPEELIENILCRLPLMDLLLNVNRVCGQWHDIITDNKFVPWKKRYFELKLGQISTSSFVVTEMKNNGMIKRDDYLVGLIKYMKNYKRAIPGMDECLKDHTKYDWALALIKERVPECIDKEVAHPWSMVAVLVVISESVSDVSQILNILLNTKSQCTCMEVVESLYCIATFLLMFKTMKGMAVWNGMHYRVYYALYLFENESSMTADQLSNAYNHSSGGQQTIMKYGLSNTSIRATHEQVRICNHNVQKGDTVKIVAFAGTGKTTTLVRYTQLRPNQRFLLVVYNKSVQQHALTKFPKNVKCQTGHSLAFRREGRKYAQAEKLCNNLRVNDVLNLFKARKGESLYVQAKLIIDTINNFCNSPDDFPTTRHVPQFKLSDSGEKKAVDFDFQNFYAEQAEKIWNKMRDLRDSSIRITHDGYLKVFQLQKPRLYDCDILLIDEAQDLTPAIADILLRQQHAKILVGDPHQQIYAFRGAVNAMQQVDATHTFFLTQSFRFGPEIAFVASSCLEFLKGEKKKTLVGNGIIAGIHGDQEGQLAIISRTNFQLFNEAAKKCCYSDSNIKIAFVGGKNGFGFDMIKDIYALFLNPETRKKENREIRHPLVKKFSNLPELEQFANKTQDKELLGKIRIVKTYNTTLPSTLHKIESKLIDITENADIVFSTAHKAKGLEFSTVRVTDDYGVEPKLIALGATAQNPRAQEDENNILYVAITRAKKRLQLSPTIYRMLKFVGEDFFYPEFSEDLQKQNKEFRCTMTGRDFEPCSLTLVKREVALGDGSSREGGMVSPQVITEEMPMLKGLYGALQDEREEKNQHKENPPEEDHREEEEEEHDFDDALNAYMGFMM